MMAVAPLTVAISAHRAAWEAFQVAPGGDDSDESLNACSAMADALDALVLAACAFPVLSGRLPADAPALLDHIRWWLAEEAEFADDYTPAYGILQGRAADLGAVLDPPAVDDADPVVAAIVAADMATVAHTATLVHRDEDDDESEAVVDAAGHAVDAAFQAVQALMPTTLASLHALTAFYARDAKIFCRWDTGGDYLEHIAAALGLLLAREGQAPLSLTEAPIRETKGIPGQSEIEAAWRSLPTGTRNRIGVIATDLVFQAFVHGDAFVATGAPKDRAIPGRSKAAQAIRDAAGDAETERLNELHRVVEEVLPALFGPAGQNPDWAVAMGARR